MQIDKYIDRQTVPTGTRGKFKYIDRYIDRTVPTVPEGLVHLQVDLNRYIDINRQIDRQIDRTAPTGIKGTGIGTPTGRFKFIDRYRQIHRQIAIRIDRLVKISNRQDTFWRNQRDWYS